MNLLPREIELRHFHLPCGAGGAASGVNLGTDARVGHAHARWRCIGGIDNDPAAIRDFERLAGATGTCLDLFSRDQYTAFHGRPPGPDWREATPEDIRRAATFERPHFVFMSSPCKGYSGLLPEKSSKAPKYQALNALALRIVWLVLEAFQDDPVELIAFENVPRIAVRGRGLLDQIGSLFDRYDYAWAETVHDCGELGNLAQSRKRFLMMARHRTKVPPFLYEPVKRPLRGVGEVLGTLPLPLSGAGGPMHRVPSLKWKTWVRLAFVEAGSDWRSLNRLRVSDGHLSDYALVPERPYHRSVFGVTPWDKPAPTVTTNSRPGAGAFSVADPRVDGHGKSVQLGVRGWEQPAPTVTGQMWPGQGPFAIADPRPDWHPGYAPLGVNEWTKPAPTIIGVRSPGQGKFSVADPRLGRVLFNHAFRVVPWDQASPSVAGSGGAGNGLSVAGPRCNRLGPSAQNNKLKLIDWTNPASTITGGTHVQSGALSVADPRPPFVREGRAHYLTAGHYGVVPWGDPSGAVTAAGQHDNGRWSVADPRVPSALPDLSENLVCVIRALDGTWHRPFTTLELAALQGLIDPSDEQFALDGQSDAAWRERIGNAVPRDAARAMGSVVAHTLLLAMAGETFRLSATPVWVHPLAIALSVQTAEVRP